MSRLFFPVLGQRKYHVGEALQMDIQVRGKRFVDGCLVSHPEAGESAGGKIPIVFKVGLHILVRVLCVCALTHTHVCALECTCMFTHP